MTDDAETISVGVIPAVRGGYRRATILAFIVCGLLTIVGALIPPVVSYDPGVGMQEWRTLADGGPANSIVAPDPANISRDRTGLVTWWSPGQYLIPGVFTAMGLQLGPALSLTAGLSLLACLLGWVCVFRRFAFSPQAAVLGVAFLATFRYSTVPFNDYNGGEILLQGITPWLILAGCYVPVASALRAAGLACAAILIGFFVKLTGVIVASGALAAGSVAVLMRLRRITTGMVAGAVGAIVAGGLLEAVWFSRGTTPAGGAGWPFQFTNILFAVTAPLGAGVSWGDLCQWALFHPGRPTLPNQSSIAWFFLPMAAFAYVIIRNSLRRNQVRAELNELTQIVACFYIVCVLPIAVLYARGGAVSLDERHFRSAGTLIFVCVLGVVDSLSEKSAVRFAVVAFCSFMSLYGIVSFVNRVHSAKPEDVDHFSQTRQVDVDLRAVEYARAAFGREGRDALFVIPSSELASELPRGARIISTHLDFEDQADIAARRYAGRVSGHVYVLIQTRLAKTVKGTLLLKSFADYPLDAWEPHQFGNTTVLVQPAPAS